VYAACGRYVRDSRDRRYAPIQVESIDSLAWASKQALRSPVETRIYAECNSMAGQGAPMAARRTTQDGRREGSSYQSGCLLPFHVDQVAGHAGQRHTEEGSSMLEPQTLRNNRGHDCELDGHVYMSDQVCNGEPDKGSICHECKAVHKGWTVEGMPIC